MNIQKISSTSFSPIRFILKVIICCVAITLILIITLLLVLPPILSSDLAREKVALYAAKDLQRPISIDKLSFSWGKGLAVSDFNIKNKDQSPFFNLSELKLIISWSSLVTGKINIESLTIKGIELILNRDKSGKTNISDILETPEKEAPSKEKVESQPTRYPALFLDAHIKEGSFTFIDQRLDTITHIKDLSADLSIPSLTDPINVLLKCDIILNDKPPESIELIVIAANLASKGKFDIQNAKGSLEMRASFGDLNALFDLSTFNTSEEAKGASLSCSLDLNKLAQLVAGILGFPPDFSLEGQLKSSFEARGNIQTHIALNGETMLKGLSIKGGPFKDASFEQPQIVFSQDVLFTFATDSIDIKSVALKSDFVNLSIAGTIDNYQKNPDLKLLLSGRGNLNEVLLVLRKALALPPDLKMSGVMNLSLSGTGDLNRLNVKGTTNVEDLKVNTAFLGSHPFQEKSLKITPDIHVNISKNMFTITSLNIRSEILSADIKGTLDGESTIDMEGNLTTEFYSLKRQLHGVLPSDFPRQGQLSSDLTIQGNLKKSLSIKGDHGIKDVKIILPLSFNKKSPPTTLSLPKLTVNHDVVYGADQDKLTLKALKADAPFLSLEGSGALSQISKNLLTTCQGKLSLDMPVVQKLLGDLLPEGLNAKGKGNLTFDCKGSLNPPDEKSIFSSLSGKGELSLEAIDYQGLGSIQDLQITELSLEKGTLGSTIECLLNLSDLKKSPPASLPKLAVTNVLVYAADQDKLTLKVLKADAPFLNLEGSGALSQISKNLLTTCQGKLSLDMPEVQKLLEDFLPEGLNAKGKGNLTFDCKGSLNPPDERPLLSTWDGNGSLLVESVDYQSIGSIQNLQSEKLSLEKGILDAALQCVLNDGPCQIKGTFDFGRREPPMKINIEAKDVKLSQDIKILGYIVPILNVPASGQLSGKGYFSTKASWRGISWGSEISKTIIGKGKLILNEGTIRGQNLLSELLKSFGKPDTLQFEQIMTEFSLKDGKIYNDNIQVNGEDLNFGIKGWTSLVYDPSRKGNPLEYSIIGDLPEESLGKDAKKVLSIFGEGKPTIPFIITGTVQKPKVSIKMPKAKDLLREILGSPEEREKKRKLR